MMDRSSTSSPTLMPLDPTPWAAVRRHARMWRAFVAIALVREVQFRANALATLLVGVVQLVVSLVPILLLFSFAGEVNGWSQADVLVVAGLQQAMAGLLAAFIGPNMQRMTTYVSEGDLDGLLVRPMNAHMHVATRWVRPAELFSVLSGLGLAVIGLIHRGTMPSALGVGQAVVLFAAGFVLLSCAWSMVATCAFWTSSMSAGSMVFGDLTQAGRYPVTFFPRAVQVFLVAIVPWALATTFPAEALTHGLSQWWIVPASVLFAGGAVFASHAFWNVAIRRYASASS
ncbi:MAG: ABC-2 family transporter protein [Thermomicrobiales bacterium]